jgi:acetylornithine/succinyldiaminopimelate/putrescine aminotransferase
MKTADAALETPPGMREALRALPGTRRTVGLPVDVIERFLASDPALSVAIERAYERYLELRARYGDLLDDDEADQIERVQASIVNFYGRDLLNPYVALGADGPWVVTTKGAVLHDSGGYGMLGQGHAPAHVLEALARPQAMANVMTPSASQMRFVDALRAEVGHTRSSGCPFSGFLFLNSGSESVTVAARIADMNAKLMTDPEGRYAGRPIRRLALRGGFHGRTHRPATFSDSGFRTYAAHMATIRDGTPLYTVEPNDVASLESAFAEAEAAGAFIEALFLEPVMGEGNPGVALTRAFYDKARALTAAHGSILLVDSIQAGLRTHGVLSLVDYPGFEGCDAPDLETYSKALNAGQYPLSVLALTPRAAALFRPGVYGNTMTSTPRAMEVGAVVLESLTPALRQNIRERGAEFVRMLRALADDLSGDLAGAIPAVEGTGLLVSCHLDPARFRAQGPNSTETWLRTQGFGVIHGGANALRYTPHFGVSRAELELIVAGIRAALEHGPRVD